MTKNILNIILMLATIGTANAQVNIVPQFADNALLKNQLWQLTLSNGTTNSYANCYLQMTLQDKISGTMVYTGKSLSFSLVAQQTKTIDPTSIGAIEYTILSSNYGVDASQHGILPVGQYDVCFQLLHFTGETPAVIGDICQSIQIEAIAPPTLVEPVNDAILDSNNVLFQWIPPITFGASSAIRYELKLVELFENQSPENGIAENIAYFKINNLNLSQHAYTSNSPVLKKEQKYAWQIRAYYNNTFIGNSEIWSFSFKKDSLQAPVAAVDYSSYAVMAQELTERNYLQSNPVKLLYNNMLNDSICDMKVYDLTDKTKQTTTITNKTLVYGLNAMLIKNEVLQCTPNHLYLLELINSRKERWMIQFIYKP